MSFKLIKKSELKYDRRGNNEMNQPISLEDIKRLAEERGEHVTGVNILFLDVSSTCTGYSIFTVDFVNRSASLTKAGAIWFSDKLEQDDKCSYMYNMIVNYFNIID